MWKRVDTNGNSGRIIADVLKLLFLKNLSSKKQLYLDNMSIYKNKLMRQLFIILYTIQHHCKLTKYLTTNRKETRIEKSLPSPYGRINCPSK